MLYVLPILLLTLFVAPAMAQPDSTALTEQLAALPDGEQLPALLQAAKDARRNDPRLTIQLATRALDLAREVDNQAALAQSLSELGIGYYFLGDYRQALRYYQESLRVAESIGDQERIANAANNIGVLYFVWGEHDRALEYYLRSLQIRRQMGDPAGLAIAYNNVAGIYQTAGDYQQAMIHFQESLVLYAELDDPAHMASTLNNIGLVHLEEGRYDEALADLQRALEIESAIDDKPGVALSLNNLGMVYEAWQRYEEALQHYRDALAIREEIGDRQGAAVSRHNVGNILSLRGEHERAIAILAEAVGTAEELDVREIVRDGLLSLAEAYERAGNHQQALFHYRRYKIAHDTLFNEERSRQVAAAQARYEVDLKNREIEVLRKDKQIETSRRNALLVGAGLAVLIMLLLFNRYRFQKRAHDEIRGKNAALRAAHDELERAARDELAHVARVATMGELAAAFAHELNQPLTAIRANARAGQNLLQAAMPDQAEVDAALFDIGDSAQRAQEIIQQLRELMRKGQIKREAVDINAALQDVIALTRSEIRRQHVELQLDLGNDLPAVRGDRIQLQQVVLNLIQNGMAAMAGVEDGQRRLGIRTGLENSATVVVAVRDHGPLIGDEVHDDMFEPFFTTKSGGLGMGLPICRTIIEAHGGRLWAERNPEGGLTLRFSLPAAGPDDR